jgi:hypothetical protein
VVGSVTAVRKAKESRLRAVNFNPRVWGAVILGVSGSRNMCSSFYFWMRGTGSKLLLSLQLGLQVSRAWRPSFCPQETPINHLPPLGSGCRSCGVGIHMACYEQCAVLKFFGSKRGFKAATFRSGGWGAPILCSLHEAYNFCLSSYFVFKTTHRILVVFLYWCCTLNVVGWNHIGLL